MAIHPMLAVGTIPPQVALLLTCCLVVFLFRRDLRQTPNVSRALWLPLAWMMIICTRQTSEWLGLFGLRWGAKSLEEGSPFDACVYFSLIAAGAYVLHKRRVQLSEAVRNNQWLTIFFLFCFLAIFWSDFPFVSFKRWIKVLGHPIMALIVLTEPDPVEALKALMRRCAYVIVPISVTFIRYFPQYGRSFDQWTGAPVNTGITTNKNSLGADCLIVGIFFFWNLLQLWQLQPSKEKHREVAMNVVFLLAIGWLFRQAHSSTALVSTLLAASIIFALGLRSLNPRLLGFYVVSTVIALAVAQGVFGIYEYILHLLHKDPTLTDRTLLWHDLLKVDINPLFGTGFESFWLGQRREALWASRWWQPNEAHNGYLETYLNLGFVGLFIFAAWLIATYAKARAELFRDFEIGRFRLGFLAAVIAYNFTEAAFKNINPMWFVFCITALDYPAAEQLYERPESDPIESIVEEQTEIEYSSRRYG